MTDRERLAKIEADQRRLTDEAETVRRSLRAGYAAIASELAVETLSEREFRELVANAIRAGGIASVSAVKALPSLPGAP
ncbi:hypothetical protein [Novosphingobium sp. G106]|uniref:hypothetical protein n=1 Tax=Novosphingobium sp. G106 TaxID=2849500 RepID=UPI0020C28B2A|nr:hypothetical protein [Novosphingobium sp. G106]